MILILRIISHQSHSMGPDAVLEFSGSGGSIGRGLDNDWILPDPERFISGHHATIEYRDGAYYLIDNSTNGTSLNGGPDLGTGNSAQLNDGDSIRIGDYEISVECQEVNDPVDEVDDPADPDFFDADTEHGVFSREAEAEPAASEPIPAPRPARPAADLLRAHERIDSPDGFEVKRKSEPDALPAARSPVEPAAPMPESVAPRSRPGGQAPAASWPDSPADNRDAYSAPDLMSDARSEPPVDPLYSQHSASMHDGAGIESTQGSKPGNSVSPPDPLPSPAESASQVSPSRRSDDAIQLDGVRLLLETAGMDADLAKQVATEELARTLGRVLNMFIRGMMDVLRARAEIKSEFRVPQTRIRQVENNPLKYCVDVPDALFSLFVKRATGFMGPVDAFEEGLGDVKDHQIAVMAGMRAAFDSMMERFDPENLEEEFNQHLRRTAAFKPFNRMQYWEMYQGMHDELREDASRNFQRLFGDVFAGAYEEQMQQLASKRRPM